jgi:putative phosphoesterase
VETRRIGIIADIHGNLPAFEAVIAALKAERVETVVCLGDVAATGPYPREVLTRLRELNGPVVMGNADAALLDTGRPPPKDEDARRYGEIDDWCRAQLIADDIDYLRSFQATVALPLGGDDRLLCYHGTPHNYNDGITSSASNEELERLLAGAEALVLAGAHTHRQLFRRFNTSIVINPGSVGLAYDFPANGEPFVPARAEFAILTYGEAFEISLRRLAYDREATLRAMVEREMPHAAWWSANWM